MRSARCRALALVLAGGSIVAPPAGAQREVAGRYDFAAVSQRGDSLHGTIHLVRVGDRLLGRVLDIRPGSRSSRSRWTSAMRW
ncbi:MAG: hypothetical protein R2909_01915 [Gemmatimonadales bacterium]